MASNPTVVGDNPFQPGVVAETYVPDQLIAGDLKLVTKPITLLTRAQKYLRGTVLGKITIGAAASAAKAGGNTGTGTFVLDVGTPILANAKVGVYTLRCIIAAANSGTFVLTDPKGVVIGEFIIPAGAGNNVAIADQIKGVLTDGGVDFIVGDGFDITIAAGSGKYVESVATATDGSAVIDTILVDDVDASGADQQSGGYQTGEFNGAKLVFDDSWTLTAITDAFRPIGIFIKSSVTASDPT